MSQYAQIESDLVALDERLPEMPICSVLIVKLVIQVGREMSSMLDQQIKPYGLSQAELRVLTTLFSEPDGIAHPGDLCVRADQSPSNLSRISDKLLNCGLLTRALGVQDRRRRVLRITEKGEALVSELLPKLAKQLQELLSPFPDTEQRRMNTMLRNLGDRLG
jgi:MarR family transcriptional repressor of emrRAB